MAEADEGVYGPPGDVAGRLDGLRDDMERERYLRLLPGYVRRFVEKSAALLDLELLGDLDGRFSLAPKRPGALDFLLPALEGYPAAMRARLCVRRAGESSSTPMPRSPTSSTWLSRRYTWPLRPCGWNRAETATAPPPSRRCSNAVCWRCGK